MPCAYCMRDAALTREHVMPQWLRRGLPDYLTATPARGRHLFGGELVNDDVCVECNGVQLSRLDEAVKRSWDAGLDSAPSLWLKDRESLARWVAKVCYNAQRARMALGTAKEEPPMPASLAPWALAGGPLPNDLALSISRLPPGHRDAEGAGIFASRGTPLPRRYVHLRCWVVLLAWDVAGHSGAAKEVARLDRAHLPAVDLLAAGDPLAIPLLTDPDFVRRGFWGDENLLGQMAKRYPEDPPTT